MDGKTHLAAGVLTGISVVYVRDKLGLNIEEGVLLVTGCGIGSLLPDIDIPGSMLGHVVFPLAIVINKILGHRTVTHSLFFMLVVCLIGILFKIPYSLNIGIFVGMSTHLVLDGITTTGIPYLLYPFHR